MSMLPREYFTSSRHTASNNTGNASYSTQADFVNTILDIHNRERAAVSVPPLVWNDTLAARAKTYAEHLIGISPCEFGHPDKEWVAAHAWLPYEAESLAQKQFFNPYKIHIANATQLAQRRGWSQKRTILTGTPVITGRWSRRLRNRSVAQPPVVVPSNGTFWTAAISIRHNISKLTTSTMLLSITHIS